MSFSSSKFNSGFMFEAGIVLFCLVRKNKPQTRNAESNMIYRIANENSMHLTCMHKQHTALMKYIKESEIYKLRHQTMRFITSDIVKPTPTNNSRNSQKKGNLYI